MRLWPWVLPSRVEFLLVTSLMFSCWMCHHFLLELRLLEVSSPSSLTGTPPSPPRSLKCSPLLLMVRHRLRSRFTKEKEKWQETTSFLVNSNWLESLQHQEVFHRSRSPLTLMPTELSMFMQETREPERSSRLSFNQVVALARTKSRTWFARPRLMLNKTRSTGRELRPSTRPRASSTTPRARWASSKINFQVKILQR